MSLPSTEDAGLSKRSTRVYSPEAVMTCTTVSLYNALELLSLIFMTFKRRSGLYFWSILVASFGVVPYAVGWLIGYFDLTADFVGMLMASIGWVLLITGQAVVLYSRLHLVLQNDSILRAVKWMIIFNAVVWHTLMTVLLFTISYRPDQGRNSYNAVFNTMEKVQMLFFCVQEFIISGLYVWKTVDILKTAFGGTRRIMWQLFMINILIVFMDIALLVVQYTNHYLWQQGLKVVMYSIKLKLEFAVLGRLIEFVQHRGESRSSGPHSTRPACFMRLSNSPRPKTGTRAYSAEAVHMENLNTRSAVACSLNFPPSRPKESDQITVTRSINVEGRTLGKKDHQSNKSTDELFEQVEISRQ
ncbi:hypothetical protein ACJ41O_009541 [Fusarium nematophilum]